MFNLNDYAIRIVEPLVHFARAPTPRARLMSPLPRPLPLPLSRPDPRPLPRPLARPLSSRHRCRRRAAALSTACVATRN